MDQCTHEVRTEYWRNVIKACGQPLQASQRKSGWMKTESVSRVIITGRENSGSRPLTRGKKKKPFQQ